MQMHCHMMCHITVFSTVLEPYIYALHTQVRSPSPCSHTFPRDRPSEFTLNHIYILMHVRWQSAGTSCMCWKPLQCISINVLLEVAAQVCAILCLPSLPPLPHIISFTVAGSNCMNAYSTGGCPKDRPLSFCCWLKNGKVHKNHLSIYIRTKCMHPHMR